VKRARDAASSSGGSATPSTARDRRSDARGNAKARRRGEKPREQSDASDSTRRIATRPVKRPSGAPTHLLSRPRRSPRIDQKPSSCRESGVRGFPSGTTSPRPIPRHRESTMMAYQLSSATSTRGVAVKAPRATAPKARVATRVQAVRPPPPPPLGGGDPDAWKTWIPRRLGVAFADRDVDDTAGELTPITTLPSFAGRRPAAGQHRGACPHPRAFPRARARPAPARSRTIPGPTIAHRD
jgi:hypothetical protein